MSRKCTGRWGSEDHCITGHQMDELSVSLPKYLSTSNSRFLFTMQIAAQLLKKFPNIYATRRFNSVFSGVKH
jgi:hypothetical protein